VEQSDLAGHNNRYAAISAAKEDRHHLLYRKTVLTLPSID